MEFTFRIGRAFIPKWTGTRGWHARALKVTDRDLRASHSALGNLARLPSFSDHGRIDLPPRDMTAPQPSSGGRTCLKLDNSARS